MCFVKEVAFKENWLAGPFPWFRLERAYQLGPLAMRSAYRSMPLYQRGYSRRCQLRTCEIVVRCLVVNVVLSIVKSVEGRV